MADFEIVEKCKTKLNKPLSKSDQKKQKNHSVSETQSSLLAIESLKKFFYTQFLMGKNL